MKLGRRVARLEGREGLSFPPAARSDAASLAAELGLDVGEVLAEARAVLARSGDPGIASARGLAAWVAQEEGREPADVLAEAERAVAAWRVGRR